MSGPTTRIRLAIHFVVRIFEITLLYGHFISAVITAAGLLKLTLSDLTFTPNQFAIPLILVLIPLVLLKTMVFVMELKSAGLPRPPDSTKFSRIIRFSLRLVIMASVVMTFLTVVFYATMLIIHNLDLIEKSPSWPLFDAFQNILVSLFLLVALSILHLEWLGRLRHVDKSLFASVPGPVQHLLPTQLSASEIKKRILRGSNERIVLIWLLGLAVVIVGVGYAHNFFPNQNSPTNLLAEFIVGAIAWLWISVSLNVFLIKSRRREIGIIDGTFTEADERSRLQALYFSLALSAGLILALACLAANLFKVISVAYAAGVSYDTFALLLLSWAPIVFYAAICMDILLIHARNAAQDQSVCCRMPIALTLGMEYTIVADSALSYDMDF